jgi:hypothetical protein
MSFSRLSAIALSGFLLLGSVCNAASAKPEPLVDTNIQDADSLILETVTLDDYTPPDDTDAPNSSQGSGTR